jgi:hypothetical protein
VTNRWWECPCGSEPPKRKDTSIPVRTVVSSREPVCVFCSHKYRPDYESSHDDDAPTPEERA